MLPTPSMPAFMPIYNHIIAGQVISVKYKIPLFFSLLAWTVDKERNGKHVFYSQF